MPRSHVRRACSRARVGHVRWFARRGASLACAATVNREVLLMSCGCSTKCLTGMLMHATHHDAIFFWKLRD
ncbi:hypothetical protein BRADI_5g08343v3 [Brachypodium distachyon]|uniref:Uncharacterized protein n=1 Tax=Brachypodium distachyon TaxID=15368 RepID=A0A0Q3H2J6_BRADI|nr:hypothetical protein BRADI_5g08343v3 [Brachypodium distachyon]